MMMRRFSAAITVGEHEDAGSVADKLSLHSIGAVLVLSTTGVLIGIITEGDLVKALSRRASECLMLTAREIMNADVHVCRLEDTELEIMTLMLEKNIRFMAVMPEDGGVGLMTLEDVVRQRLQKVSRLAERTGQEGDNEQRLAILERHLKENWSIFEVFRAVRSVQERTELAKLDDRSRHLLWLIGDGDSVGRPHQMKNLLDGNRLGTFPTLRKSLDELLEAGLIEPAIAPDLRGKSFKLSQHGHEVFGQMTKAVSDVIMSESAADCR